MSKAKINPLEPERRFVRIAAGSEIRAIEDSGKKVIEGYAAVFNVRSENLGGFYEYVRPTAFNKTIQEADIRGLFNHSANYVLGRNKSGTLRLGVDTNGLEYKIDLPNTSAGRDVWESVRRGDVNQNSFSFDTIDDNWYSEKIKAEDGSELEILARELREVRLYDVGPVTFPAYPQTTVSARNLFKDMDVSMDRVVSAIVKRKMEIELSGEDREIVQRAIENLQAVLKASGPVDSHPEDGAEPEEYDSTLRYLELEMARRGFKI